MKRASLKRKLNRHLLLERNESFFWCRFTIPDTRKAETGRTPVQDLPGRERVQDQPGKLSETVSKVKEGWVRDQSGYLASEGGLWFNAV